MTEFSSASDAHRVAQILRDLDDRVTDLEQDSQPAEGDVRIARRGDDDAVSADQLGVGAPTDPVLRWEQSAPAGRPSPTGYDPAERGAGPPARSDAPPAVRTGWGAREWAQVAPSGEEPSGFGYNFGYNFGVGRDSTDS